MRKFALENLLTILGSFLIVIVITSFITFPTAFVLGWLLSILFKLNLITTALILYAVFCFVIIVEFIISNAIDKTF